MLKVSEESELSRLNKPQPTLRRNVKEEQNDLAMLALALGTTFFIPCGTHTPYPTADSDEEGVQDSESDNSGFGFGVTDKSTATLPRSKATDSESDDSGFGFGLKDKSTATLSRSEATPTDTLAQSPAVHHYQVPCFHPFLAM